METLQISRDLFASYAPAYSYLLQHAAIYSTYIIEWSVLEQIGAYWGIATQINLRSPSFFLMC